MTVVLAYDPSDRHLDEMRSLAGERNVVVVTSEEHGRALMRDAEAWLGNLYFLQSLPAARRLRWMQSASMGVDVILQRVPQPDFVLTTAKGCYDDEVADHALALVLACARRLDVWERERRGGRFARRPLVHLSGRRAVIVGFGGVGRAVAQRLAAFGMRVDAIRRAGRPESPTGFGGVFVAADRLADAMLDCSVLVLALPFTEQTVGMLSSSAIANLPPGAVVVNVGRGETVDEPALLAAAAAGHIVVGLDVFRDEPLPAGHPLWNAPNTILTPHVARSLETGPGRRFEALFADNFARWVRGEPLRNVVDPARGY